MWSHDLPELAQSRTPEKLTSRERVEFVKAREHAQQLLKVLFPEDTDGES